MRRLMLFALLSAYAVSQAPQTPRQALLEMVRATSPEQSEKHLPEVLLDAMKQLPNDVRESQRRQMALPSLIMAMNPNFLKLYDTGPTLAVINNPKDGNKVEITVERDDLTGDLDAMEFGIRVTKNGKEDPLPVGFRVLVDMKLEKGTWRLAKIGGSVSMQLDDPVVAALLVKQMQEQAKRATQNAYAGGGAAPRTTSEANVVSSLRTLVTAETAYTAAYPQAGYTCRLADLGGSLSGKGADEHSAQLINPALEAGTRYGYRFELSGCSPRGYRITATPSQKGAGHPVYCADESGVVKSAAEGGDCFSAGTEVK